ncbi:MAG: hypothetical protein HKN47_15575 [Pirellulaceae bacterium]|nr:hypothetical protein [Pirellulaceae bacterium]
MTDKKDWRSELEQITTQLRDPFRMRVAVAGVTLVVMFFAISEPLHGRIKQSKRELEQIRGTSKTAEEVVLLRSHLENVEPGIMRGDSNDVVTSHLIDLVRQQSVDLQRIDAEAPTRLGPIKTVRVNIDVSGSFQDLTALLHALESGQYLIRVENIVVTPPERNQSTPTMQLSLRVLRDQA